MALAHPGTQFHKGLKDMRGLSRLSNKALNERSLFPSTGFRGVNLGGWLNTEPFIVPALYEPYVNASIPAVDEWTLSQNMAADTANGGLSQLEKHYQTFIVSTHI